MARSHADILLIVAGVFLFLPSFAQALLVPQIEVKALGLNMMDALGEYFRQHGLVLLLLQLPAWLGGAALLALLVDPARPTVGQALSRSLTMLPSVIALNWLSNFALMAGLFAFIIPGVYLFGRILLAAPAQMAGHLVNPFAAFEQSMALSRGNGWRITGLFLLVGFVLGILQATIGASISIILSVILPKAALAVASGMLSALLASLSLLVIALLSAAVYRQLSGASNGI
jgi:hypothetical protein